MQMISIPDFRRSTAMIPALVLAAALAATQARAQTPASPPAADSASLQRPYDLSEVEVQPRLLNGPDVARAMSRRYPREMKRRGEAGHAIVRMLVRPDGTVDSTRITAESATHSELATAATEVVRQMRFAPAKLGGKPVAVWVTLPVTFAIESRRPEPDIPANVPPPSGRVGRPVPTSPPMP